ncbi:MAG: hypothetical protein GF346_00515 [Candidatus Eisenbacteria bacterium]|nr:hypothetical protein [Candidatus Latescibacterota bacterium]MBD3300913.1 hypothetical protein [Candidatus Eisenbacteria bacterium]
MLHRWFVPLLLVLLGLGIGGLILSGPEEALYPVAGDSAKYHAIGQGFARLYADPIESIRLWASRDATTEELARYGFDSWVLTHAPAYTAYLGAASLLAGDDERAGRWATILLFALGAAFLYRLGLAFFGFWPGILAALLYLFWPSNWVYGSAILTELPVAAAALGAALALWSSAGSTRMRTWILGGIALGLLILTKTTLRYLAVPLVILEALLDSGRPRRLRLRRAGGRLLGFGATQAVWLLFLWGFQLSPNPLAATGEDWLWIYRGNYVPDRGWETVGIGDAVTPELRVGIEEARSVPEGRQRGAMYREAFLETLRRHPVGMPALMLAKAGHFWRFPAVKTDARAGPLSLPPPVRIQPALAIAGLVGLALCIGRSGLRPVAAAIPLYLTLLHGATHFTGRYNIPAVPFAMLYGFGAVAVLSTALRGWLTAPDRVRRVREGFRRTLPVVLLAAAGAILALGVARLRPAAEPIAPWIAAVGAFPLVARLLGGEGIGRVRGALVLGILAFLATGSAINDPDPDRTRVRLDEPGEGVRAVFTLPPDARPHRFVSARLLLDLLPSERGDATVSIRIGGREVGRFVGRPPSDSTAFLLDRRINAAGDRWRRVLRSVRRQLEGFVRKRPGLEDTGYAHFRQWFSVPVDPEVAFADPRVELEVVLVSTDGGWIDLYVDRAAPPAPAGGRRIAMPAFFRNPYELSNYRFDALATDREQADARLVRPVTVYSEHVAAERFDRNGEGRRLSGEPRIRLRGGLPGGYGLIRDESGAARPMWVLDPAEAIRMLTPAEIRSLMSDRDRYFDGYLTY